MYKHNFRCSWTHIWSYSICDKYFSFVYSFGQWRILNLSYTENLAFDNPGWNITVGNFQFFYQACSPIKDILWTLCFHSVIIISGLLHRQFLCMTNYSCKTIFTVKQMWKTPSPMQGKSSGPITKAKPKFFRASLKADSNNPRSLSFKIIFLFPHFVVTVLLSSSLKQSPPFFFLKIKVFMGTELFGMNPKESGMLGLSSSSFFLFHQHSARWLTTVRENSSLVSWSVGFFWSCIWKLPSRAASLGLDVLRHVSLCPAGATGNL